MPAYASIDTANVNRALCDHAQTGLHIGPDRASREEVDGFRYYIPFPGLSKSITARSACNDSGYAGAVLLMMETNVCLYIKL